MTSARSKAQHTHAPTVDTPESTNSRKRSAFAQNSQVLRVLAGALVKVVRANGQPPQWNRRIGATVTRTNFV